MDEEKLKLEQEKVIELMQSLSDIKPGTDEWKDTTAAINILQTKINEGYRNLFDYDCKTIAEEHSKERSDKELALKEEELKAKIEDDRLKRRNNMIVEGGKMCVSVFGIVVPLWSYAKFQEWGYLFEKKAITTSPTFKNFIRHLKPTWK